MGQRVCGIACSAKVPKLAKKAERVRTKARKEAIKKRSKWLAEAQEAVNDFVRARDGALPCVSCGCCESSRWNASHYRSVGSCPELRFDTANIHRSCAQCNLHLHGNPIPYRVELLRRIGLAEVERIEGPHDPKKYTIPDLRAIIATYKTKLKELQQ
jgi:hypothetical protein